MTKKAAAKDSSTKKKDKSGNGGENNQVCVFSMFEYHAWVCYNCIMTPVLE
jgi:hypothetical protein